MAVQIDKVDTTVDVIPPPANPGAERTSPREAGGVDREQVEKLRPIVLLVLREELERMRRQQG